MLTLKQTIDYQDHSAQDKVALSYKYLPYAVSTMLAGAYIGVGVLLMCSAAGPFLQSEAPAAKLVSGAVFGIALSLVTVAGSDLLTSTMMTLTQAARTKAISVFDWGRTLTLCFAGNLAGSALFAFAAYLGGLAKHGSPLYAYLEYTVTHKAEGTPIEVFFKAVLCNVIVCLAIWCGLRLKNEVAKLIMIFWCALAFITGGLEHVVANMTTFSLALFEHVPGISIVDFASNMLFAGLGNLVGGGVIVGLGYVALAKSEAPAHSVEEPLHI